ncbi:hypothetical protein ACFLSY_03535 [Bacteroidota bacterium]
MGGIWRSLSKGKPIFDLRIDNESNYNLTSYEKNQNSFGKISSTYNKDTNTLILQLENQKNIELWMISNGDIIMNINNLEQVLHRIM